MTNRVTSIYDDPLLSLFAIVILCYKGDVPALNFVSASFPIPQYSRPFPYPRSQRKVPVCLSGREGYISFLENSLQHPDCRCEPSSVDWGLFYFILF